MYVFIILTSPYALFSRVALHYIQDYDLFNIFTAIILYNDKDKTVYACLIFADVQNNIEYSLIRTCKNVNLKILACGIRK